MKENLLVIDDDKFVCKSISALLEKAYSVEYALTGKDGVEKFLKASPSIVFVDYLLPDIDGLGVVNELKQINQEVSLIFVTGSGNMELVIKALRAGVFDYIEKPIQSEVLIASLRRLETFRMLEQQRHRVEIERDMLVFSLRHELNNLYAIISGNIQLLENEVIRPQERRRAFTAIKTALNDCMVIMSKLKGCVKLKPLTGIIQSLDINLLVTNVVSSLRYIFAETGSKAAKITTNLGNCKKIEADPTEIREVLINVLSNAFKAIKDEGIITISTSQEKDFVTVKISDTGSGIPEEIKEKLFRPFSSTGGTGIGLFWSRFIVSQYGGTLDIESTPRKGTTVTMRLPCGK